MKVTNMTSPRTDKPVANQFIITNDDGTQYFQSYESIIAKADTDGTITLDGFYWNYSVTTSKYRNQFTGLTTKETQKRIDSGEIKLLDLNG